MLSVKGVGIPTDLKCPQCGKAGCTLKSERTDIFWLAPDIRIAHTPMTTSGMRKVLFNPRNNPKKKSPIKCVTNAANRWLAKEAAMEVFSPAAVILSAKVHPIFKFKRQWQKNRYQLPGKRLHRRHCRANLQARQNFLRLQSFSGMYLCHLGQTPRSRMSGVRGKISG